MGRRKRIVAPGQPHHITQRGTRRGKVFFCDRDRQMYLDLLAHYASRYEIEVVAYCLMENHVHHLLIPKTSSALSQCLQITHKRYADSINAREGWTGHLWQERFYSSPVDEEYFWTTIRYIERNPNEAGFTKHPIRFAWSSANFRCDIQASSKLLKRDLPYPAKFLQGEQWISWLTEHEDPSKITMLKDLTMRSLPCGSEEFLDKLERTLGLSVRPASPGRPKKVPMVPDTNINKNFFGRGKTPAS